MKQAQRFARSSNIAQIAKIKKTFRANLAGGAGERGGGWAQAWREHQHLEQRPGWRPQGWSGTEQNNIWSKILVKLKESCCCLATCISSPNVQGSLPPLQAYLTGRISTSGDVRNYLLLSNLDHYPIIFTRWESWCSLTSSPTEATNPGPPSTCRKPSKQYLTRMFWWPEVSFLPTNAA